MSRGGKAHITLIDNYSKLLNKMGYRTQLEKKIMDRYIVDIYAERDNEILIIECGYTAKKRLAEIKKQFKVIHVTYLDIWVKHPIWEPISFEELVAKMGIKNIPK